ncbi:MAG: hypothetical protein EA402_12055 [Planctomycetota bacterium]|nr:MAG: hypothetical protein EA402_12055 [Planctomycetota bacterium]
MAVHQGRVAIARPGQPSGELGPGEHLQVWDAQRVNWQQPAAELTQHLRRGHWQDEQGLRSQHQLEDQSLHRWDLIWQIPVQSQAPVQRLSPLAGSLQLNMDLALECRLQLALGLHDPADGSFVSNLILTWDAQTGDARRSLDLSDPSLRRFSEPEQNLDRLLDIRRAHLTAYSMHDPGLRLRSWGWSAP